jgi:hypothetical protein
MPTLAERRNGVAQTSGDGHAKSDHWLAWGGPCLKSAGDPWTVKGYLVRFTSADDPDLSKQFFNAKTNFGDHTKSPIYYDHGINGEIKRVQIGTGTLKIDSSGVWIDGQLDKANRYARMVAKLRDECAKKSLPFGWSSGTASHLVEVQDVKSKTGTVEWIKKWPLGLDASLTPTPCDPDNHIQPLKSYKGVSLKEMLPEQDASAELEADETEPFEYDPQAKVGHTMCAKMANCHAGITAALMNKGAIGLNEYGALHGQFADSMQNFHTSLGDVAHRPIDNWDREEAYYKSGDMMKTIGDAYHAGLTRAFNAGADHMLTRGHVSKKEHGEMKKSFDGHIVSFIDDMDGGIRDRKLDAIGSPWLPIKTFSGDFTDRGSMKLADEADALLGSVNACIKNAKSLTDRFADLKGTREKSGDKLGVKATGHIEETVTALTGLVASLKKLIGFTSPQDAAKARLAEAEAFERQIK